MAVHPVRPVVVVEGLAAIASWSIGGDDHSAMIKVTTAAQNSSNTLTQKHTAAVADVAESRLPHIDTRTAALSIAGCDDVPATTGSIITTVCVIVAAHGHG